MSSEEHNRIKESVKKNSLQGHICIQDADAFDETVKNGIYGFPHKGDSKRISYFRSVSSLYNIGIGDLIFLYRKKGDYPGNQEINGPFKVTSLYEEPDIFYDNTDTFEVLIKNENRGRSRFLFEKANSEIRSITNNYKLIEKFENRKIWGFRHPTVMNIGAARKKSIAALTTKQTIELLDILFDPDYSTSRDFSIGDIPSTDVKNYYKNKVHKNYSDDCTFPLTERYIKHVIKSSKNPPCWEHKIYPYLIRGFKRRRSVLSSDLLKDFEKINGELLSEYGIKFNDISKNVVQEAIASTHLQEEMEILLSDPSENNLMILEIKRGDIIQDSIDQTINYIDLLKSIFPEKNIFANIVGCGAEKDINNPRNSINLVEYIIKNEKISFSLSKVN